VSFGIHRPWWRSGLPRLRVLKLR